MPLPILVLTIVFVLFAIRKVGRFRLEMWLIMLLGAFIVLATRKISFISAMKSINPDVMIFLFCMFVVGKALEESGYLDYLFSRFFRKINSTSKLLLSIIFLFGFLAAFLMNDTVAIIGTPVLLFASRKNNIKAKPLLLALAYSITVGSTCSPIGNPQNLLIAINSGMKNPFSIFGQYLLLPTIVNLFAVFFIIKAFFKNEFNGNNLQFSEQNLRDANLANISKLSLSILFILIIAKVLIISINPEIQFKLTYIGICAMAPIIILSKRRLHILKNIDWHTLIFFASMFVLMESIWETGFFQRLITESEVNIFTLEMIFLISIIFSQFLSNVPLVALYLPLLKLSGFNYAALMSLAAASTIAGNFFILGAVSNVIVIHNAEKRSNETINAFEFSKIGIPLTIINAFVFYIFIKLTQAL